MTGISHTRCWANYLTKGKRQDIASVSSMKHFTVKLIKGKLDLVIPPMYVFGRKIPKGHLKAEAEGY